MGIADTEEVTFKAKRPATFTRREYLCCRVKYKVWQPRKGRAAEAVRKRACLLLGDPGN